MPDAIDLHDPEYTIPGELDRRPVEAWPERIERRVNHLEERIRHLEQLVYLMLNPEDEGDL